MEILYLFIGIVIGGFTMSFYRRRQESRIDDKRFPEFLVLKSSSRLTKPVLVELDTLVDKSYATYERTEQLKRKVATLKAKQTAQLAR